MPDVVVLGGGPAGGDEVLGTELREQDSCLDQRPQKAPSPSALWRHSKKAAVRTWKEAPPHAESAGTSIMGFPASKTVRSEWFLFMSSPSLKVLGWCRWTGGTLARLWSDWSWAPAADHILAICKDTFTDSGVRSSAGLLGHMHPAPVREHVCAQMCVLFRVWPAAECLLARA